MPDNETKRPGGPVATRPLYFYWIVDCSSSMSDKKIDIVNTAIQNCIPEMRSAADDNLNAQLLVRALKFSDGANWVTPSPIKIENFVWQDLEANGLTSLGAAFDLLTSELNIPPMPERALPPVLVLLTDGMPTQSYKTSLSNLLDTPWGSKSVRVAIAIGKDADKNVLQEFTGNSELVLEANNVNALVKCIKWASTLAKKVSESPKRGNDTNNITNDDFVDLSSIPVDDSNNTNNGTGSVDIW